MKKYLLIFLAILILSGCSQSVNRIDKIIDKRVEGHINTGTIIKKIVHVKPLRYIFIIKTLDGHKINFEVNEVMYHAINRDNIVNFDYNKDFYILHLEFTPEDKN